MTDRFGLANAGNKLRQRWEQTKTEWNDPVSRELEQTVLTPLAEQMRLTLRELDRLTQVIEHAQRQIR